MKTRCVFGFLLITNIATKLFVYFNQSISQSEFIHAKGNNKTNSWYVTNRLSILLTKVDLKKVLLRGCSKIELQY